jgi:gluconolactonase
VDIFTKLKGQGGGLSFREDGNLVVGDIGQHKISSITSGGILQDIAMNVTANFLTTSSKGIYFTDTEKDRVGFYSYADKKVHYESVADHPTGLALNAEQTFLNVGLANNVLGYSFKIVENGTLENGQEYIHYHIPYGNSTPGAGGMTVDSENLLYTATKMGVQISDQLGRVNFIISSPSINVSDVKLGGGEFSILYVSCNGKLFSRKTTSKGILSWQSPIKPPKPGL